MQKTRNLFVLNGKNSYLDLVLTNLQFKGLTVFPSSVQLTMQDVLNEFHNNKSVVCSNLPKELEADAIKINVITSNNINLNGNGNFINVVAGDFSKQFKAIADAYGCDIGDHKSDSSGLNGAPSIADCPYCVYINSNELGTFDLKIHRTVYRSKNFFMMPTLGEFIKGYLLIIPNEHVTSISELSPDLKQEFLEVLDDAVTILKLTYPVQDFLVWENGTGNGGIGKAKSSVVHSHVHIAPSKLNAFEIQKLSGFPLHKISFNDLSLYGKHSYLLVKGVNNDEWWINDNPNLYIPRQYVRQLIADEYGLSSDTWNWRTHPFKNLIQATCKDIQNALIRNWDSLPSRIKENTKDYLCY